MHCGWRRHPGTRRPIRASAGGPLSNLFGHLNQAFAETTVSVQADKACINRGRIDEIIGHGHAATGEIAVVGVAANLQINPPDLFPCVGIEGDHQPPRSGQIQPIVCVYGCRLERRPVGSGAKRFGRLTRVVGPPNGQFVDRVRRDAIGPRLCRNCEAEEAYTRGDESHADFDATLWTLHARAR